MQPKISLCVKYSHFRMQLMFGYRFEAAEVMGCNKRRTAFRLVTNMKCTMHYSPLTYPSFYGYSIIIFLCGFLLLEQEPVSRQTSHIAYLHRCEPQDSQPCSCLRWTTGARPPVYLRIIFTSRETKHFCRYRLKRGLRVFQLGRKICPEGRDKVMFTTVHIRAKRVIKIAGRSIGFVARLLSVPHHMSLHSFNIMPQGVCSSSRYFSVFHSYVF